MSINQATPNDAEGIALLAQNLRIDPFRTPRVPTQGFLIYALRPDEYKFRMRPWLFHKNRYFLVSKENARIDGFLLAYDDRELEHLKRRGAIGHESGILGALMQVPRPFVFGDQIGIDRTAMRSGRGTQLLDELFGRLRAERVRAFVVAILHRPLRNQASIEFCTRRGLRLVAEVRNEDNTEWGIYRIDIV